MEEKNKRIILYELKIETFFDSNGSGYGDFNGLLLKKYYFQYLGINLIAIPDILNQYQNKFELEAIKNRYGSLSDFIECINEFRKDKIEIAPIINIGNIKQAYINWNNMYDLYNLGKDNNAKKHLTALDTYLVNESQSKITLDELSNFIQYLNKIISFYNQLKVKTIILTNYEFLLKNNNLSEANQFRFLQDVYKIIKRQNVDMQVILKSSDVNKEVYSKMLQVTEPCFDYLYLNHLPIMNLNQESKFAKMQPLPFANFFHAYRPFLNDKRVILSLGSDQVGRINSRWGDELAYAQEATKTFLMFVFAAHNSIGIYYGDELGMLRAKIKKDYQFENDNFNEEKRFYQAKNISEDEFFKAQLFQNKITSYTYMSWNNNHYAGATKAHHGNFLMPEKWQKFNVEKESNTESSSLKFANLLLKLVFGSEYSETIENSSISFKFNDKGIAKIIHKNPENKTIIFLMNLSKNHLFANVNGSYRILATTYTNKFYATVPKQLAPFESLILIED
ncbi:alpha-amylase family glycosyl hydrolase [Metamycoplasma neophronis]|uniref:Glucan 1,6-alpha-glucosidase n=1 Tax=Metamycoplasma neophronis TaxID=872983 RepID=A0ABY2Z0M5_9BACT|nr:alpha-amylase family glycosyl hydrolase [Metamycoplasma neophronis]TPR54068.1 glucan 1,6-alpha-glucosidase [Metamycoplasma neophronis]